MSTMNRGARWLGAVAGVSLLLVTVTAPAEATHEITAGQARYADGTTTKTATAGTTLTITATGIPRMRSSGTSGGVLDRYWLVTVGRRYTLDGKNIPCYQGFEFVHPPVGHRQQPGGVIPDATFTVPTGLTSGQWEVCFYSQPFEYVTAPVLLNVP